MSELGSITHSPHHRLKGRPGSAPLTPRSTQVPEYSLATQSCESLSRTPPSQEICGSETKSVKRFSGPSKNECFGGPAAARKPTKRRKARAIAPRSTDMRTVLKLAWPLGAVVTPRYSCISRFAQECAGDRRLAREIPDRFFSANQSAIQRPVQKLVVVDFGRRAGQLSSLASFAGVFG